MLKRMEVFMIASLLMLVTAIILIIFTMQREQEFIERNDRVQSAVVDSAAYAIDIKLDTKRRLVSLFIDEYSHLFRQIQLVPDDEVTIQKLSNRLQQRFPSYLTFTTADDAGTPVLLDIESLVGEACQADLHDFAGKLDRGQKQHNEIFIHPQPFNYHYDVMAELSGVSGNQGIFFVSFYLDEIADILKTHEIPGLQLFLVRESNPGLIEVSREGARDKLSRNPELSQEEQHRILQFANVKGADWRVVVLQDARHEQEFIDGLWQELIVILVIMYAGFFLMIWLAFNISERKRIRERDLAGKS